MNITIVGSGEVGRHLAQMLDRQNHDINLMDESSEKLSIAKENTELNTLTGKPTSLKDLKAADAPNADLFIAVTEHESQNLTACMLASSLGAKKCVARINNSEFLEANCKMHFRKMGIDELIYPEMLAAEEIVTSLQKTWNRQWMEFGNGALKLIAMKVRQDAPILNTKMKDLRNSENYRVVAIRRDTETIIPKGEDAILANDVVYFFMTADAVEKAREAAGKEVYQVHDIAIMGGSKIAVQTCKTLPKGMHYNLFEKDRERAKELSLELDGMVLNDDLSNLDSMKQEEISDCDAFVALTESSEANILACLQAKQRGVKKTVAEVENISYIPFAEKLDIGTVINKKLIAASYIYQYTLDADVSKVTCLTHVEAEVVELIAISGSEVTQKPVYQLNLPKEIFIGGYIRNGKGAIVTGSTQIEANDSVIVFCMSQSINLLDRYFK